LSEDRWSAGGMVRSGQRGARRQSHLRVFAAERFVLSGHQTTSRRTRRGRRSGRSWLDPLQGRGVRRQDTRKRELERVVSNVVRGFSQGPRPPVHPAQSGRSFRQLPRLQSSGGGGGAKSGDATRRSNVDADLAISG